MMMMMNNARCTLTINQQSNRNKQTSSSAVAEKPRDASCLSVVTSFSSTIRWAYWLLRLQVYCYIQLKSILFSSLGVFTDAWRSLP